MAKIIFATGEIYEGDAVSVYEAAKATFGNVSRDVLAALVNGELPTDLYTRVQTAWHNIQDVYGDSREQR